MTADRWITFKLAAAVAMTRRCHGESILDELARAGRLTPMFERAAAGGPWRRKELSERAERMRAGMRERMTAYRARRAANGGVR